MTRARQPARVTTDEQALLATVFEHPHDDLPRLVYADWLEERGDPDRAEFIRVQCELAALDAEWADAPPGLREREADVLARRGEEWTAAWPAALKGGSFERGFPRPPAKQVGAAAFEKFPARPAAPLWDFDLSWPDGALGRVLTGRLLPQVDRLGLRPHRGWWTDDAVDEFLAGQDRLPNVSALLLGGGVSSRRGTSLALAVRLVAGLRPPHLTVLRLPHADPVADVVRAVDAADYAPRLRRLDLGRSYGVGAAELAALRACRNLSGLRSLAVERDRAPDWAWADFVTDPAVGGVRDLDLGDTNAGDDAAAAFAADPGSARLRRLRVWGQKLTGAGLAALAASDHLDGLRELWVRPWYGSPGGLRANVVLAARFRGRLRPADRWESWEHGEFL